MKSETALREVGFFKPIDAVLAAIISLAVITAFVLMICGAKWSSLAVAVACIIVTQLWIVSLVYRCNWYVIKVWADVKMMPADAAKLAVGFIQRGGE